jgi:HK97 family phage major capsid protein
MKLQKEQLEKLEKLRAHNTSLYKGDAVGTLVKKDVSQVYEDTRASFMAEVLETRQGVIKDRFDRKLPAYDISFADAISDYYGIVAPDKNASGMKFSRRQKEVYVIRQYLKQNEVFFKGDTLASTAQRFGFANMNAATCTKLLLDHSSFDALNNTQMIPGDYRFIIPELILAAIRLDYEATSMYQNWISSEVNITQRTVKMPQIRRGNSTPRKIGEAESIPFGSVRFGQKQAGVFKIGTGFKLSDELIEESTIDMLFEYLGEVGTEMSIATDSEAMRVLINGEQANALESCPVIGVQAVGAHAYYDIKLGTSRMKRMKRDVTRIITNEIDGINISLLPEFKGFNGVTQLVQLTSILGVPDKLDNDVYVIPSGQIMLISPDAAMVKLKYKGMMTETRRDPQTGEDEVFVSDYVGFAIKRRDGRLIIDNTLAYGAPDNATFPAYMDIDARISSSFVNLQGV